jgi:predicted N-acyltransferase
MGELDLTFATSIEQVAPDEWNALCGGRAFVDHRWLRFTELALLDHRPRFVLLRHAGQLVAAAVCGVEQRFAHPSLQRRAGWLLRHLPCLRCEVPIASEYGLIFRSGVDEARLTSSLLFGVRRLALREHALFTTVGHVPVWDAVGGAELSRWQNTVLDVEWATFDEYLAARPRDDRHEIRRMRRRAEREGITVDAAPLSTQQLPLLRGLIRQVQVRHNALSVYTEDFLERAVAVLAPDVYVLLARQADETIGCAVVVRSQDELLAKWLGLNYERTLGTGTYFALLSASVGLAIELRVSRLRLGATAYSTKEQFGVALEERVNLVLVPSPLRWLAEVGRVGGRRLEARQVLL